MKKHWPTVLKVLVSVIGSWWVINNVSLAKMWAVMKSVHPLWLLFSFLLINISLVVRAWRWQVLLRGLGVRLSLGRLTVLYIIGNFFNAFLPSGFGGDVVRAVETAQDVAAEIAAGTVIVDRLTGLLMLFMMSLIALPFRPSTFPTLWYWVILVTSVIGLVGGFILLEGRLTRWLDLWIGRWGGGFGRSIHKRLMPILLAVQGCGWQAITQALIISALFNLILALWWYAISLGLGLSVSFLYYLIISPIISLALLIPSIGGLGLRESLTPMLLAGAGVPYETGVALALLLFALQRLSSLLGFPFYLQGALSKKK